MARIDEDFSIETEMDLDAVDETAAKRLDERGAKDFADIEIEEVPDPRVSERDRKAKPLPADSDADPTEEELAAYSESVRKRINKLTHGREDERRAREQAQRERDEAVQFAQHALARAKTAEEGSQKLRVQSTDTSLAKLDGDIAATRKEYVEAANAYDSEAMADAQLKMATLVAQKNRLEIQKEAPPIAQPQTSVQQSQPTARPPPDKRAQEWAARNDDWFQKDKSMTAFAFGVHEDLVSQGFGPRADVELYYTKLDEKLKFRFPEKFEPALASRSTSRPSSPVAPATRTANGRRRVTLSSTEMSLAHRLGVTPEQFAAEKLKLSETR